jgi:uncharacterized protein (DUF58 family)
VTRAPGLAALGVLMCVIAAGFAAPSLYVPGIGLLLLSAGSAAWVGLAAHRVALARRLMRTRVEEDSVVPMFISFEYGRVPFPGGELVAWQGAAPRTLSRSVPARLMAEASFPRRGRQRVEPARLRIRDPLGICVREVRSAPAEVLVLPRVEPVNTRALAGIAAQGRHAGHAAPAVAAMELDSIGPYRPGTPASRIHWPSVAKTGKLMERRLIADADRLPLIVVDPRPAGSEDELDLALRAAASLCVHLARLGGCALLLPGDRRATAIDRDLHAWPALHARLAVVEADDGVPRADQVTRARSVLWVSPGASMPAALRRAGATVRFLVTPRPLAGLPVSFMVAGCAGQRLRGAGAARVA